MENHQVTIVIPHCYNKKEKELSCFHDGLSIMVGQIVDGLASRGVNMQVYMTNEIYSKKWGKQESISYFDNTIMASIRNLGIRKCIKLLLDKKCNSFKKLFFSLSNESFWSVTDKQKTILNFHDLTVNNCYLLQKCIEEKVFSILTLHIYIGKDTSFGSEYNELRKREKNFLPAFNGHIIVVSEGMKRRILQDYPLLNEECVEVIENGIEMENDLLIYEEHNKSKKAFLCVGTISNRKNQIQLLNALSKAPHMMRDECEFVFCGIDTTNGKFEKDIKALGVEEFVKYIGRIDKEDMKELYLKSFAVISCSLSEAFGLAFIEAYSYGRPCVFFSDIDAADYLFDDRCCVLIKGKRDEDILKAIDECIQKEWNTREIRDISLKYDIANTISKYIECYDYHKR